MEVSRPARRIFLFFSMVFIGILIALACGDLTIKRRLVRWKVTRVAVNARAHPLEKTYPQRLLRMAHSTYSFEAVSATIALGDIGDSATIILPELAALLNSSNRVVSREAARSLARLGPRSAPVLSDLESYLKLGNPRQDTTWFVAEAIGNIGADAIDTIPLLQRHLGESDQLDASLRAAIGKLQKQREKYDDGRIR